MSVRDQSRGRWVGAALLAATSTTSLAGCFLGASDGVSDPKSVAIYDVAHDEFKKGRLREALAKVNEALEVDRDNADAAHLGALIYLAFCAKGEDSNDCRYEQAEKLARLAVKRNAELREAKNTLAVILIHEKKHDEAIEILKLLTEDILYGSPQTSWGNLGWAYLEKGDADHAIDALRRAVASQPNFCVGNYRLGAAYEKKGELKAAIAAYSRALATERPGCNRIQEAWEGRARASAGAGLVEEARGDYTKCIELARNTESGERCAVEIIKLSSAVGASHEGGAPKGEPPG
ncbi:MAG: tetratricopeptide repeat protein [Polyangiaceae bacterium]